MNSGFLQGYLGTIMNFRHYKNKLEAKFQEFS